MKLGRLGALALVAASASAACVSGANADQILTYTGQDFTLVSGSYTTSDKLTATIDLASPLGDNLNLAPVTPTSFSFSDGVQTFTQADSLLFESLQFSTNSSGVITGWAIDLELGPTNNMESNSGAFNGDAVVDGSTNRGENTVQGSWTEQTSSVPEPLTLSLFGAGLAGAVAMRRRRGKAA